LHKNASRTILHFLPGFVDKFVTVGILLLNLVVCEPFGSNPSPLTSDISSLSVTGFITNANQRPNGQGLALNSTYFVVHEDPVF
jgi:hypothetical protein